MSEVDIHFVKTFFFFFFFFTSKKKILVWNVLWFEKISVATKYKRTILNLQTCVRTVVNLSCYSRNCLSLYHMFTVLQFVQNTWEPFILFDITDIKKLEVYLFIWVTITVKPYRMFLNAHFSIHHQRRKKKGIVAVLWLLKGTW